MTAGVRELAAMLGHSAAGVRRIAVLDLIGLGTAEARAALTEQLSSETDERAAILIIRALGSAAGPEALAALRQLYERRETPVRIAHAAMIEHDRILGRV
jgi:HEAT repeat protein